MACLQERHHIIAASVEISDETLRTAAKKADVRRPGVGKRTFRYEPHDISRIARQRKASANEDEIERWNAVLRRIGEPELGFPLKAKSKSKSK